MFNFNNKYFYFSVNYLSSPHHRYNNLFILRYKNFFFYNLSLINYSINISLKFIQAISRGNGVLYILHAMQSLAGIRHLRILRTAYLYSTIGTRKGLISNYKNQMKLRIYRNIKKKHLMTVPPAAVLFLNPSDNFYEIKQMRNYQIVSLGISSAEFGAGNIFNYNIYGSLKLKEFSNNLFTTLFLLHVFLGYKERYLNIYTKFFTKFSSLRNSKLLRRYRAYSYLGIRTFNFRRRQAVKAEQRKRRKAQRGGERAIRKKVRWMRNPRNRGKTFITREKKDKFWLRSPFYIVRKERLPSRYKVRKLLYPQMAKMRKRRRNRFVMEIVKRRRLRLVDIRRRIWRFYWGRFIKKRLKRQSFSKKRDRKFFRKYNLNIIRPRRNVRKVARWVKKRRFRFLKSNEYKRYYTNKIHRFSERVRGNLLLKKKLYNTFIRTVSYRLTRRSKRHLFNKRYRHLHRKLYIYGAVHLLQQNRLIPRFKHRYPYTNYYRFRKVDLDDRKLLDQRLTYSKYFPIKGVKAATNKKSSRVFSRNFYGYVTNYLKKKKSKILKKSFSATLLSNYIKNIPRAIRMYADANRAIKIKKGTYLVPKVVERYLNKKGRRKKPRIYQPTTKKRAQSSVYQQSLGRATFLVHPTKFVKSAYFITHFPNSIRKFNYEFKGWGWRKDLRIRQYNQTLQDLQNTVRKFQFSFIKANKYKKKRIYLKKFKKKYGGTSKRFKKLNKYATSS